MAFIKYIHDGSVVIKENAFDMNALPLEGRVYYLLHQVVGSSFLRFSCQGGTWIVVEEYIQELTAICRNIHRQVAQNRQLFIALLPYLEWIEFLLHPDANKFNCPIPRPKSEPEQLLGGVEHVFPRLHTNFMIPYMRFIRAVSYCGPLDDHAMYKGQNFRYDSVKFPIPSLIGDEIIFEMTDCAAFELKSANLSKLSDADPNMFRTFLSWASCYIHKELTLHGMCLLLSNFALSLDPNTLSDGVFGNWFIKLYNLVQGKGNRAMYGHDDPCISPLYVRQMIDFIVYMRKTREVIIDDANLLASIIRCYTQAPSADIKQLSEYLNNKESENITTEQLAAFERSAFSDCPELRKN